MQHIRLYDLTKCAMLKKILTGTKWLSSIHLDGSGNNIFVGGLDRVFSWIDLELSNKPWKSLRSHSSAIRALAYHGKLPLLATVSDDATAIVYHARCPQVSRVCIRGSVFISMPRTSLKKTNWFQSSVFLAINLNRKNSKQTRRNSLCWALFSTRHNPG